MYAGTYLLMLMISSLLTKVFPESAENLQLTYDIMTENPFGLIVLVMCVMPAIGEEIYFRGLLFGSLREKYKPVMAIFVSSLIFGVFHLSLVKILPTGMLGACFAYITYMSGSIYIGMALHFFNNLLSTYAMKYPEQIEKVLPVLTKTEYVLSDILLMLGLGIICVSVGMRILKKK